MRILVVENDAATRSEWLRAVDRPGCLAVAVRTSSQASHMMRFNPFDLMVLSLALESGSALPLAHYAAKSWPKMRVIAVRGEDDPEEDALEALAQSITCTVDRPAAAAHLSKIAETAAQRPR